MPIYDYACTVCHHRFEVFHGLNEAGPHQCPECGSPVTRVFAPPTIVFKGTGWAKLDRRNAGGSGRRTKAAAAGDGDGGSNAGTKAGAGDGASSGSAGSADGTGTSGTSASSGSSAESGGSAPGPSRAATD